MQQRLQTTQGTNRHNSSRGSRLGQLRSWPSRLRAGGKGNRPSRLGAGGKGSWPGRLGSCLADLEQAGVGLADFKIGSADSEQADDPPFCL
jgi:hypothetical protein